MGNSEFVDKTIGYLGFRRDRVLIPQHNFLTFYAAQRWDLLVILPC